jgi:hypothetical protein
VCHADLVTVHALAVSVTRHTQRIKRFTSNE